MSENQTIGEAALHAFVDNELDPEATIEVEGWLQQNPDKLHDIAVWKQQNGELKAAFDPVLEEQIPIEIQQTLNKTVPSAVTSSSFTWRSMAASIVLLMLGASAGWVAGQQSGGAPKKKWPVFAQNAISSHVVFANDISHPVEYAAPQKSYLLAWVKHRMNREITPPNLDSSGFRFLGGRMLSHKEKPAVLFMYEDINGKRITVLIGDNPKKSTASSRLWTKNGVSCVFWFTKDLSISVTSDIEAPQLKSVSNTVETHFLGV